MKKTLLFALAGMMLFAFTQCGGGDKKEDAKEDKATTKTEAVEETKATETTKSVDGTKQFNDLVASYEEIEKALGEVKTCEELEQVAFALALGSLAIELGSENYGAEERITDAEKEKFEKISDDLIEKAQKKAEKLGCDLKLEE